MRFQGVISVWNQIRFADKNYGLAVSNNVWKMTEITEEDSYTLDLNSQKENHFVAPTS